MLLFHGTHDLSQFVPSLLFNSHFETLTQNYWYSVPGAVLAPRDMKMNGLFWSAFRLWTSLQAHCGPLPCHAFAPVVLLCKIPFHLCLLNWTPTPCIINDSCPLWPLQSSVNVFLLFIFYVCVSAIVLTIVLRSMYIQYILCVCLLDARRCKE